jgi:hypothetical protein
MFCGIGVQGLSRGLLRIISSEGNGGMRMRSFGFGMSTGLGAMSILVRGY